MTEKTHTTEQYVALLLEIDRKNKIIADLSARIKAQETTVRGNDPEHFEGKPRKREPSAAPAPPKCICPPNQSVAYTTGCPIHDYRSPATYVGVRERSR